MGCGPLKLQDRKRPSLVTHLFRPCPSLSGPEGRDVFDAGGSDGYETNCRISINASEDMAGARGLHPRCTAYCWLLLADGRGQLSVFFARRPGSDIRQAFVRSSPIHGMISTIFTLRPGNRVAFEGHLLASYSRKMVLMKGHKLFFPRTIRHYSLRNVPSFGPCWFVWPARKASACRCCYVHWFALGGEYFSGLSFRRPADSVNFCLRGIGGYSLGLIGRKTSAITTTPGTRQCLSLGCLV